MVSFKSQCDEHVNLKERDSEMSVASKSRDSAVTVTTP